MKVVIRAPNKQTTQSHSLQFCFSSILYCKFCIRVHSLFIRCVCQDDCDCVSCVCVCFSCIKVAHIMQRAAQSQHGGGLINQEGLRELLRLKKVFRVRSFVFTCQSFSAFWCVICDNCVPATWMVELDRATKERFCVRITNILRCRTP